MCFSKAVVGLLKPVSPVLLKVNAFTKHVVFTHVPSGLLILGVLVNGFRRKVVDYLCFSKLCFSFLKGGFARMFQQSGPDAAFSKWFCFFLRKPSGNYGTSVLCVFLHRISDCHGNHHLIAFQIAMGSIIIICRLPSEQPSLDARCSCNSPSWLS